MFKQKGVGLAEEQLREVFVTAGQRLGLEGLDQIDAVPAFNQTLEIVVVVEKGREFFCRVPEFATGGLFEFLNQARPLL